MNNTIHNILIVGYGFVGKAVHHSLIADRRDTESGELSFKITILDPAAGFNPPLDNSFTAIFVCVPTPTVDGTCDDSIVLEQVEKFKNVTCPLIIRSTIPPSSIKKILSIKPDIVYMPEFLREKHWQYDAINPEIVVIGTDSEEMKLRVYEILEDSSIKYYNTTVSFVSPIEASLFKYAANTFLAMKVVYMHELHKWMISENMGDSWSNLSMLMKFDSRFGSSHFDAPGEHGYGYSGSCFPKDTQALVTESKDRLTLLKSAIEANTRLRNSV